MHRLLKSLYIRRVSAETRWMYKDDNGTRRDEYKN